jgi:hypothetical protein
LQRVVDFKDAAVKAILKEDNLVFDGAKANPAAWAAFIDGDADFEEEFQHIINDETVPVANDTFTADLYDTYLNMELALERGDHKPTYVKVTKCLKDKDGLPIDTANDNPILDSRMYEVEYQDGYKTALAANVIAENLFAQVDQEGNRQVLFRDYRPLDRWQRNQTAR